MFGLSPGCPSQGKGTVTLGDGKGGLSPCESKLGWKRTRKKNTNLGGAVGGGLIPANGAEKLQGDRSEPKKPRLRGRGEGSQRDEEL